MCQTSDLAHLGIAQFEIDYVKVFLKPLYPARARNDDNSLLNEPAQANLCRALAVSLANLFQYFVAWGATARDRTIGHDRHPVPATCADDLVLVQEGVAFDLIADQGLA